MKKQNNVIKGAIIAVAVLVGSFVHAEDDGCGACSVQKVIALAKEQGIVEVKSLSYSLGNWKVEGVDGKNVEVAAKVHCPQVKNSKAKIITIDKASHVSMSEIADKVKKLTSGKIQKIEYNGYYWKAIAIEGTVELEYQFDKEGNLKGQLVTD